MKFKRKKKTFKPVTITLETEKEAAALAAALAGIVNDPESTVLFEIYDNLDEVVNYPEHFTCDGIIKIKGV